jgi:hypothetical protein
VWKRGYGGFALHKLQFPQSRGYDLSSCSRRSKNYQFFDNYKKVSIRWLSIPHLTEGDFRPLNPPRKLKLVDITEEPWEV